LAPFIGRQLDANLLFKPLDEVLHVGGDYFLRGLPLLLLLPSSFDSFASWLPGRAFLFLTSAARQKRLNGQTGQNDDRGPPQPRVVGAASDKPVLWVWRACGARPKGPPGAFSAEGTAGIGEVIGRCAATLTLRSQQWNVYCYSGPYANC